MPYLVELNGSKNWKLPKGLFTAGFDASCDLRIDQTLVSKEKPIPVLFQILARADGSRFLFESVDVKGLKVNEKLTDLCSLSDGDVIKWGTVAWKFQQNVALSPQIPDIGFIDFQEPFFHFLESVEALIGEGELIDVLPGLLRICCYVMGADQGRILWGSKNDQEIITDWPEKLGTISKGAIETALSQNKSICWNQQSDSDHLDMTKSIVENKITSILVSPFWVEGVQGYLYLQRQSRSTPFSEKENAFFERLVKFCMLMAGESSSLNHLQERVEVLEELRNEEGMLFRCDIMQNVIRLAEKAASLPVPLLITGPTGSGKEQMAKFVHRKSKSFDKPFLAVNCGAIPESLMESVLFGHKKGSFTGAVEDKKGLFEECKGGVLFLDEIGELPLNVQVKLLRVLQEKVVTPVGSVEEISVDFRLLAATHVDLENAVETKQFRQDLFFRLNVMQLELPPLCERGQDILLLARAFLKRFSAEYGMRGLSFTKEAEKSLLKHRWPGNIRELANRIQKALVSAEDKFIKPENLDLTLEKSLKPRTSLKEARENAERKVTVDALSESKGNLTLAASILGIDRKVLRELMQKLELDKEEFKQ